MKKNTIIAAIAAASALLLCASCQKQEIQEQNSGINAGGKVFTATIEQALTKTTITNEYKVNWVEGDKVSINGVEYTAVPDSNDPTKAALTPPAEGSAAPVDDKYYAVYPASIMVETVPTLPATQIYTAGQFNAPMYAESGTETFTFKNICGVLCLSLNGTDKVKSIAVTANEQICGPFEFIDAESFCFSGENEGYTVTLDCGEGVQLSSNSSTNFYVYLPPFESYTAGLKIVVTNTEGKTFEKITTTAVKIERNNIYTFNWTAAFAPVTKGTAKAIINDVDTDVKWIQLWENGPKFAEYNVSSTRTFAIAKKTGADYIWGVNWRTPSKDELNELLLAAQGTSTKVTCVYGQNEEGVWGFNFTGKEAGYTCNSLFFPTDGNGNSDFGDGYYWSSTPGDAIGSKLYAFRLWLCNSFNDMTDSALESVISGTGSTYSVKYAIRPVLAE